MQKAFKPEGEVSQYRHLTGRLKVIYLILVIIGIGSAVVYHFNLGRGTLLVYETAYYYLFIGVFLACVFITMPARNKDKSRGIQWYDLLAALLAFGISFYLMLNARQIAELGMWRIPTLLNAILAFIYCILLLEGGRRAAGSIFTGICLIIGLYPLFAGQLPGLLFGFQLSPIELIASVIFTVDGLLGMPASVLAGTIIGYLLFSSFLVASDAGPFFLNLATALMGRFRGGTAKVAVLASGFFGSLSGSAVSNVIATGSVTIPAMKRSGYPAQYAGAIEACASTGGALMPPVMSSIAFLMCAFLGVDYGVVIVVAIIPSLLYYFGLMVQVDAVAARSGLKGLPREEIPSLKKTLMQGWTVVLVLAFLIWGLLYMKWTVQTPYYAIGLLILISCRSRKTMITPKRILKIFHDSGKTIALVTASILPMAFILVGLNSTGFAVAFTSSLVNLGGDSLIPILIFGVIASYVLGMIGMVGGAYLLLAISVAPAAIKIGGLNELAVHFFLLYYALLAFITPPVAIASFTAASIAGSNPMKTAVTAMRLAIVIYFIPFFFVFNPSLILQGSWVETAYLLPLTLVGIFFIAEGLGGYLIKLGRIRIMTRVMLVIAGFLIAFPQSIASFVGLGVLVLIAVIGLINRRWLTEKGVIGVPTVL